MTITATPPYNYPLMLFQNMYILSTGDGLCSYNYLISGSNGIPDSQITASSDWGASNPAYKTDSGPSRSRINTTYYMDGTVKRIGCWSAFNSDQQQYIQVIALF